MRSVISLFSSETEADTLGLTGQSFALRYYEWIIIKLTSKCVVGIYHRAARFAVPLDDCAITAWRGARWHESRGDPTTAAVGC
jgi:hypothetical protein